MILTAVVRAPTPLTKEWVHQRLATGWQILNCPDLTLGQASNLARLAVTGRHVAFIDGYDLWCETWLTLPPMLRLENRQYGGQKRSSHSETFSFCCWIFRCFQPRRLDAPRFYFRIKTWRLDFWSFPRTISVGASMA